MPSKEYLEHVDWNYEDKVRRSAMRLREAADDFEKQALSLLPGQGQENYPRTAAAARAIHALQWGSRTPVSRASSALQVRPTKPTERR